MKVEIEFTGFQQRLLLDGKVFIPKIFSKNLPIPEGFNTASLFLDCSLTSSLHWRPEKSRAFELSKQMKKLFWKLYLGALPKEIDEMHFLSLELALEHFIKDIWSEFESVSLGVSLFEGKIEELTENVLHDLKLLASRFPEDIACFLLLDASNIKNPFVFFDKTRRELFGHFHLILKGPFAEKFPYAVPFIGWDLSSPLGFFSDYEQRTLSEKKLNRALLLPKDLSDFELEKSILFETEMRVISEVLLTNEWEGVDDLVVFSSKIEERVQRKLQGFIAAGGHIDSN